MAIRLINQAEVEELVQRLLSAGSTLAGANDTSPLGLASTLVSTGSLIGGAFIPGVGQALSAAGFFIDVAKTYNAVQACPK